MALLNKQRTQQSGAPSPVEPLEERRMLSAAPISFHHGRLMLKGTSGDDAIHVSVNASDSTKLDVDVNGTVRVFDASAVRKIMVVGKAGNDDIEIGADVNVRAMLNGGAGNDTLVGGAGNDKLRGGAGNDLEDGGEGDDNIQGGMGDDSLDGGDGNDSLDGGDGADDVQGDQGNDQFAADDDASEKKDETSDDTDLANNVDTNTDDSSDSSVLLDNQQA